jgi:hypothetical protein
MNDFRANSEFTISIGLRLGSDTHRRDTLKEWSKDTSRHLVATKGVIGDPSVYDMAGNPAIDKLSQKDRP